MSNMINCKACGKEIAKGVNKCVHCGKDQRNILMQHKIISAIVGILILGAIGVEINENIKDKSESAVTVNDNSSESTDVDKNDKEELKDSYEVNEEAKLNDTVVKVTKVIKSNGNEFDKPQDGMEYAVVTVNIKNGGSKEVHYNPFNFRMENSKGQITDEALTTLDSTTRLNDGSLSGKGEVSGTIAFQVPQNDNGLVLRYKGNIFSNKEIKFKLS